MENFEKLSYKERVKLLNKLQKQHREIRSDERKDLLKKCPYCGLEKIQRNGRRSNGTQMYLCPKCRKSFSENTGTCYHNVKSKDKMRQCIQMMASGYMPVNEMADSLGVSVMTAFSWRHKILTALIPKDGDKNALTINVPFYKKGNRVTPDKEQKRELLSVKIMKPLNIQNNESIQNEFLEWVQTQMKGVSGKYIQHYAAWFRLISENVTPVQVDEILEKVMVTKNLH